MSDADRRLLLVHAHPDDESLWTGATMAAYAAAGAQVTLITCTRGELGEIIPPEQAGLSPDELGEYRTGELAAACAALGVSDHRFLGGAGRWRDSGMMGDPGNDDPRSFWRASLDEAAAALLTVIAEVRPQVVISYDANGFYGHPDHIQAHRVTERAFGLAGGAVAKRYATAMPASLLPQIVATGDGPGFTEGTLADLGYGVPDEAVTTRIDASGGLPAKLAAMRAHPTQIIVSGSRFALSDRIGQRAFGQEFYTLLAGPRGPDGGPDGQETDLFAGLGPAGL
jgi:N-acetyl-1-D-myo-inositol-2-amino-2-deoxy-alpha-D-glucopyranoside deacetylase